MIEPKKQLEQLVRVQPDNEARLQCLRLDLNENVSGLPDEFVKGIAAEIDAEFLCTYPQYRELKQKIADRYHLKPGQICLGNGSDGIIKYFFDAYISQGDRVLLTNPTFAMYNVYCRMFGAQEVIVDYNADLSFPLEEFKRQLADDIRLAVVVNPNNPTGTILSAEQLHELMQTALDHKVLLMVDEAYFHYYPETAIADVNRFPNVIVLQTFSKLCALASSRIGYAAADEAIIHNLEKVKPTYDVNGFGVIFANRLLDQAHHIDNMIQKFEEARDHLCERLESAGIPFRTGAANFVLIDVGERVEAVMQGLKDEQILVGGGFSQPSLKNYIRVTIANKQTMDFFLEKFLKVSEGVGHE